MFVVVNKDVLLIIIGNGDVVEFEYGLIVMGFGGGFVQVVVLVLLQYNVELSVWEVVEIVLNIVGLICVFINQNLIIEELDSVV